MSDGESSPVSLKISLRTFAKVSKPKKPDQRSKSEDDKQQVDNLIDNQNKVKIYFFRVFNDFQPITAEVENGSPKEADPEIETTVKQVEKMDIDAVLEPDQMETDVALEPLPDLVPDVEKSDSLPAPLPEVEDSAALEKPPLETDIENGVLTVENDNTPVESGTPTLEDSPATVEKPPSLEADIPMVENNLPNVENGIPMIESELQKPLEETVSFAPEFQAPIVTPPPVVSTNAPDESLLMDEEMENRPTEVEIPTKKFLSEHNFVLIEDIIKSGVDENNKLKYQFKGTVFQLFRNLTSL